MKIEPFALERFFARYEFDVPYNLASSAPEGLGMNWLLERADPEARSLWEHLHLDYTESQGLPLLRAEIAGLYSGLGADQVLVAVPEEAIFIAMNCLLRPGDHVVCTFPGYQSLYAVAQALGCEVSRWEPEEDTGWRFDLGRLEELLRPNTRLIVCNFPHNPTGYLPPVSDWQHIVALAARREMYLFSDEMYRWLEYDPAQRLPSALELYERALVLAGMSKTFGLPGLRIGWLTTHDAQLLCAMQAFKDYTTFCASAPSEILALIALRARDEIIALHLQRIARNLQVLDVFLCEHAESLSWVRPRAGTIGFLRLLKGESSTAFCQRVLQAVGVMFLPSAVYDYADRHLRIGLGHTKLPQALERLGVYLRGH